MPPSPCSPPSGLALRALGLTGRRPPLSQAGRDPGGYLAALRVATEEAELTDPAGLGGFGWLIQAVGVPLPAALEDLARLADPGPLAGLGAR